MNEKLETLARELSREIRIELDEFDSVESADLHRLTVRLLCLLGTAMDKADSIRVSE